MGFLNKKVSLSLREAMPVLLAFFCFVRSQEVLDGENQACITTEELFYKQPSLQQLNCPQKSTWAHEHNEAFK